MTKKNSRNLWLLTATALFSIPAALLYTSNAISNQPEPERQQAEQVLPRVSVQSLSAGAFQARLQLFGELKAEHRISLTSEVTGRVVWRNPAFSTGNQVSQGEVLIRIDDTGYQARLADARQQLAEARLALQQEQRQKRQARQDWKRAGINEKPDSLTLREPQLDAAQARFNAARAAVSEAEQALARTELKAPFSAVIVERVIAEGSYLSAGDSVATLHSSDSAEIELALTPAQWQQLPAQPQDAKVQLFSPQQPDQRWQATLAELASHIDPTTRLRTLKVQIAQPLQQTPALLTGSFLSVEIEGRSQSDLFALPGSALTADGYLWYVQAGKLQRARRTPVFSHNDTLYVPRGELPARIELVLKPVASYLPGSPVEPALATIAGGDNG